MDQLGVITRFLAMSKVPATRSAVVQDEGVRQGFVLMLASDDARVVSACLEALQNCCQAEHDKVLLAETKGLLPAVKSRLFSSDPAVKKLAVAVYGVLLTAAAAAPAIRRAHDGTPV